jgi:ribulose bisphosphate carboxylase small subunit
MKLRFGVDDECFPEENPGAIGWGKVDYTISTFLPDKYDAFIIKTTVETQEEYEEKLRFLLENDEKIEVEFCDGEKEYDDMIPVFEHFEDKRLAQFAAQLYDQLYQEGNSDTAVRGVLSSGTTFMFFVLEKPIDTNSEPQEETEMSTCSSDEPPKKKQKMNSRKPVLTLEGICHLDMIKEKYGDLKRDRIALMPPKSMKNKSRQ